MTIPDPSYVLPSDVKENTRLTGLDALSDDDLTILIQTAEDMVDAYVGPQKHHWKDSNINRVFPREQDVDQTLLLNGTVTANNESPIIPYQVSMATLRQVEWLYTQWWGNSGTDLLPIQHDAAIEDVGGDGSYSRTISRGGMDLSQASMAPQARVLLDRFRSRFAGIDVSDPLSNAPIRRALTSDQTMPSTVSPYGYPV